MVLLKSENECWFLGTHVPQLKIIRVFCLHILVGVASSRGKKKGQH